MSDHLTEITPQALKEIFDNASLPAEIDSDGEVCVKETYKIWLSTDDNGRFVRFRAAFNASSGARLSKIVDYANTVNNELILIRATGLEGAVLFDYYLWSESDVSKKNIVMTYRAFARALEGALAKDTGSVLG